MSNYQEKEGQGALFKNNEKTTDKHPDLKGKVTIAGDVYYISAWMKTSKNNQAYVSFSMQKAGAHKKVGEATSPMASADIMAALSAKPVADRRTLPTAPPAGEPFFDDDIAF